MDTRDLTAGGVSQRNTWSKTAPPTSTVSASKPNIRLAPRDAAPNSSSSTAIPSFIAPVGQKQAPLDEENSDFSPSNENSESESSTTSDSRSRHSNGGDRGHGVAGLPTTRRPLELAEESDTSSRLQPAKQAKQELKRHVAASDFYGTVSKRRATRNVVTYCEVAPESSEEEEGSPLPARSKGKGTGRRDSDSDFVMSEGERARRGASGSSSSEEEEEEEEDESEEEYRPKYKKKTTSARKSKFWDDSPETYGVWRGMERGGGARRSSDDSDGDSDYDPRGRKVAAKKGHGKRPRRVEVHRFLVDDNEEEEEEEEEDNSDARHGGRIDHHSTTSTSRPSRQGKVSYKESSVSEETDVEYTEGLQGAEGEVGTEDTNAIEKILKKRIAQTNSVGSKFLDQSGEQEEPSSGEPTVVQYLVKWTNHSHLHSSWETEESLLQGGVKGMKKFYNYLKREEERGRWQETANLEDVEFLQCQEEMNEQLFEQYTLVERVIAARTGEGHSQEYLCKWRGLPYSECTWEDSSRIADRFLEHIDSFLCRNQADTIPSKSSKVLRNRPKFVVLKEQPELLGGPAKLKLRDYQLDGVNFLVHSWCKENSVILADEMGLGKTIQTIGFLHYLFYSHNLYGPFLVVVPLSTLPAWQKEFELWSPDVNLVVLIGDTRSRQMIYEYEWTHPNSQIKFNAILTTYEILLKEKDLLGNISWAGLIVDEAHRLKNDDSLLYRTLMEFKTSHRLLITGTPLQNSLKELWSLLHFIMENTFPNWEQFEAKHKAYGEGDTSSLSSLHHELEPYLFRRIKKDVEKSLPAKVEQILRVDMSSVQKQYYRWILTKNYKALSRGVKGSITGFINIVMELKKCCNHIWIVREPDSHHTGDPLQALIKGSGKLFLLDKLLVRLKETGHRVLIFSQMVRMLDILAEYLKMRHFHYQRLDGSIRGDKRKDAIDHFNSENSQDFCFLLSTRAGGLGVNLATADTVIIFDSDWNPQNDLQAQARAHRIGQTKQVNIYRLVTKNSIEEDIVERAKKKMVLDHLVIQKMDTTGRTILSNSSPESSKVMFDKDELIAILKFGTDELFKEGDKEGDSELQEMDIDEILRRAEMQEEQSSNETSAVNELLSQFKVASFAIDEGEGGEEEEEEEQMEAPLEDKALLLSPSSATVPPHKKRAKHSERSWEDIIPEDCRIQLEEEEKTKEQLQLYLPPRQRTVQNYSEEMLVKQPPSRQSNRVKQKAGSPAAGDKGSARRRGSGKKQAERERVVSKSVRGFSESEVRRFIKSYQKFPTPQTRLEDIATDAELQEKSLSELGRLAAALREGCSQAETEHAKRVGLDPEYDPKKDKGAGFMLGGVLINVPSVRKREEELATLSACIPDDPQARKRYRLVSRAKSVNWAGVRWTTVDDAKLLLGVYEHGFGNWENIKNDPNLGLSNKILPLDRSLKPQISHLQTRVEHLFKLLKSEARKKSSVKINAPKASRVMRPKAPPITVDIPPLLVSIPRALLDASNGLEGERHHGYKRKLPSEKQNDLSPKRVCPSTSQEGVVKEEGGARGGDRQEAKCKKSVSDITESPRDDDIITEVEMDKETFQKCKSVLRPVKKCLSALNPPDGLSTKQVLEHYKKVLMEIGDHIQECVEDYKEQDEITSWRRNLWLFVSKFTPAHPQKLYRIYKKARKERGKEDVPAKRHLESSHEKGSSSASKDKCPPANLSQSKEPRPSSLKKSASNLSSQHRIKNSNK